MWSERRLVPYTKGEKTPAWVRVTDMETKTDTVHRDLCGDADKS